MPFDFEFPVSVFEKSDAGAGKQRRIGGVISTERPDRQDETILQRGLDFSDFLTNGWYNDNHSKKTTGILGYPEEVQQFQKGDQLPNGRLAKASGTWAEGYLLDTKPADDIWELGKALQKTGRSLGFSVEGSIQRRIGPLRKTIAKAKVRNVAITNCPVNSDSKLEILAKSLEAVEASEPDVVEKALTMGTPGVSPTGTRTGEGAGQVMGKEDLESDVCTTCDEKCSKKTKKSLTDSEAIAWVQAHRPNTSLTAACRIVEITKNLKRQGRL
jgi:hypothetical protein